MVARTVRICTLAALCLFYAAAQDFHTYVGRIEERSVLLAWGTTTGTGNTIGRESGSHGKASVSVGPQIRETDKNWVVVDGLSPDTEYPYSVSLNGKTIASSTVRTYPEKTGKLAFFVMGDWGTGSTPQFQVAERMQQEYSKHEGTDNPVRFVLAAGDNIYAKIPLLNSRSGDKDSHWRETFFLPYANLLAHIPFYPALGNHDGNQSESRGDLNVYLDNFFFPGDRPERWYRFSVGGLLDVFALDSTTNSFEGPPRPAYEIDGPQFQWAERELSASHTPWKIVLMHHPPFTAGPRHEAKLTVLRHFVDLFSKSGVDVVFNGHEHNFQFSERNGATGGVQYVVSGAGGELRGRDVTSSLEENHIAAFGNIHHFLLVEIEDAVMRITPIAPGAVPMKIADPQRRPVEVPLVVEKHANKVSHLP
ncbi:MAG: metallophosphoesterase [Bryobacteraceae bacterium]